MTRNGQSISIPMYDRFWAAWRRRRWRGFHRTWSLHEACGGAGEILVRSRYGPIFSLDPTSYIDGFVIQQGFYESEVVEALRPAIAQGGVLWDIGANIGLHAVTLKSLCPAATVCAFEPAPAMMTRLQRNAGLNRLDLSLYALALSDRDGIASLSLGSAGNPGMSTLSPWHAFPYAGTCRIATARGDRLVADGTAPMPTAIKLDVEGFEPAVLRGLHDVLRSAVCRAVVFEDGPDETESKQQLRAGGFAIRALARYEDTGHALANFIAEKS